MMKLPDAWSMHQALAVREVVAVSEEEVDVWYGEGPGNPRMPIQGDELVREFAGPGGAAGTNFQVPLLQYITMAWAPYFKAAQLPEAARRTLAHGAIGDVDASGVHASKTRWREAPPQQATYDVLGRPLRST